MDLFEAIKKRHSYRKDFNGTKIPKEDLIKIVQAGIDAPSGCNAQSTSFVIVDDESIIEKMRGIVKNNAIKTAQAVIVVLALDETLSNGLNFYKEDYSAAVENMLLAITALGYATVWIDGALRRERKAERIAQLLGVPDDLMVSVVLPMGVPKVEVAPNEKLPFDKRAWFNGYKK